MLTALEKLRQGTYDPASGQIRWWTYYDRAIMAAATLEHTYFAVPKGQGGKTLADTNMPNAALMPQGHNFEIHAIEAFYVADGAKTQAEYQNVIDMMRDTYLQFEIEALANQLQLPIQVLFGNPMPQVVTGAAAGDQVTSRAQYKGMWELPVPIVLAAETSWRITMTHTVAVNASLADDELMISLVGALVSMGG